MRYSIEPRDTIYEKGYGFLSFAKNMGENLSNKYGHKFLDRSEKSTTDTIKTPSRKAIQNSRSYRWFNKIADKMMSVLKKSTKELPNDKTEVDVERATPKKRYICPEKRQQINGELRLA